MPENDALLAVPEPFRPLILPGDLAVATPVDAVLARTPPRQLTVIQNAMVSDSLGNRQRRSDEHVLEAFAGYGQAVIAVIDRADLLAGSEPADTAESETVRPSSPPIPFGRLLDIINGHSPNAAARISEVEERLRQRRVALQEADAVDRAYDFSHAVSKRRNELTRKRRVRTAIAGALLGIMASTGVMTAADAWTPPSSAQIAHMPAWQKMEAEGNGRGAKYESLAVFLDVFFGTFGGGLLGMGAAASQKKRWAHARMQRLTGLSALPQPVAEETVSADQQFGTEPI